MRELNDIILACKEDTEVSKEELYYGLLALSSMQYFNIKDLQILTDKDRPVATVILDFITKNYQMRNTKAYHTDPQVWLGKSNDPREEEFQKRYKWEKKLFNKILNKHREEKEPSEDNDFKKMTLEENFPENIGG